MYNFSIHISLLHCIMIKINNNEGIKTAKIPPKIPVMESEFPIKYIDIYTLSPRTCTYEVSWNSVQPFKTSCSDKKSEQMDWLTDLLTGKKHSNNFHLFFLLGGWGGVGVTARVN